MKKLLLIVLLLNTIMVSALSAECGDRRYTGNEVSYTTYLLSGYIFASSNVSKNDACVAAKGLAQKANDRLSMFADSQSVYNGTKIVYNKLFTANYMNQLKKTIAKHLKMKGKPTKEAINKATLLVKVINKSIAQDKNKYLFQNTVVIPYLYNVKRARNFVKTTDRFSKKGRKMKACGYMICN